MMKIISLDNTIKKPQIIIIVSTIKFMIWLYYLIVVAIFVIVIILVVAVVDYRSRSGRNSRL